MISVSGTADARSPISLAPANPHIERGLAALAVWVVPRRARGFGSACCEQTRHWVRGSIAERGKRISALTSGASLDPPPERLGHRNAWKDFGKPRKRRIG